MKKIIKEFRIDNRIRLGYGSAFFLLLISYLFTIYANSQLQEQARRVDQTNQMITKLENLGLEVSEAVAAFRGFVIVRDPNFLKPYFEDAKEIPITITELQERAGDNKSQQASLLYAKKLIDERFREMNRWIEAQTENDFSLTDSVRSVIHAGKIFMDRLRTLTRAMQIQENYMLANRTAELTDRYETLNDIKTI
jgi:CHASE3 domain sensor protein